MRLDQGRVVIGSLARIVACLAVLVVMFHDGIALGLAQVNADSDAKVAARAGAQAWHLSEDFDRAYQAAAIAVVENGSDVAADEFEVERATGFVNVTINRETSTMAAKYFSWFDQLTNPTSTARARVER